MLRFNVGSESVCGSSLNDMDRMLKLDIGLNRLMSIGLLH